MSEITGDLNATIANAVQARIEAEVTRALSGDEVMSKYVSSALNQEIEVGRDFRKTKTTYLQHTVKEAIREATKTAVTEIIGEETELIRDEVRKAFRRKAADLADGIVDSVGERAAKGYGVEVSLRMPNDF